MMISAFGTKKREQGTNCLFISGTDTIKPALEGGDESVINVACSLGQPAKVESSAWLSRACGWLGIGCTLPFIKSLNNNGNNFMIVFPEPQKSNTNGKG
jgi:hypothetical protein